MTGNAEGHIISVLQ